MPTPTTLPISGALRGPRSNSAMAGGAAVDAGFLQRALHHLELVGPLAELAQLALGSAIERPHALLPLLGQAEALQGLEPADAQGLLHGVRLLGGGDHQDAVLGSGDQRPVEPGQALLPDLVEELLDPLHLGLGAQLQGDEGLGASAHAMADVVARHDRVLALRRRGRG